MADIKISQLPSATTPLAGTEEVPLVQSGTTKKVTVSNLRGTNVTAVTATLPVASSGGTTPNISMAAATTSVNGYLTSTDWNTFNNKQPAGSYLTNGGALGTPSSGTATNLTGLPLTTGVTGLLPVANGGTGTASPSLVQGTNVTITGTWPNQTINATGGGGGSGTVTSVAATVPSFLNVTGSPITTSGTLAIAYSGTALPIANGGTNATTATAARGNILPSYTGNAGKVLAVNTGATDVEFISAGGTGTVTSVAVSGGTTGLTTSGGPITAAGTITLAGTLAVASGGTGTATPSLVQGTNVTITGTWPNQTINSTGAAQVYPGAGIANSTGTAWGTSYTTSGTGTVVALATSPALTNPSANQINDTNGNQIVGLSPTTSAVDYLVVKNGIGVGVPLHVYADGASANTGLHIQPKGTGLVTISDGTDFNKGIRFRSSSSAASAITLLDAVSTAGRVVTLPDATTTLVGRDTTDTLTNKTINLTSNTLVATSAQMAAAVSDETGSGSLVFATSPTLVTPALGTPTSATLTNATGLPISTGVSGLGTGVATALAVNVGSAGAPLVNGGVLGTPSSGTVTNLTGTASININGTVGATTANTGAFTSLTATSGVISANTSSDALRITQTGAGNAILVEDSTNPDSTPFVIDSSGSVIQGATTIPSGMIGPAFAIVGANAYGPQFQLRNKTADSSAPYILYSKDRASAIVQSADNLGTFQWSGYDGASYISAAYVRADVDGTPGTNDMPGRLVFATTSDGASSSTERVRIDSAGQVGIGTSAPVAKLDVAGDYKEGVVTANTTTAYTISLASGTVQILTLTGNCTYTFPTPVAGKSFILVQKQDATGSRTVTWPASVKWPAGTAPTITSTASKADKFVFTAIDSSSWLGSVAGQNYTV